MSGEQAEERTARERMTKHTDSSRSTDSGVSGNAETSESEIRKIAEAAAKELFTDKYFRDLALESNNHTDHEHAQDIAAAVIEKACSRLASRVEELEKVIAKQSGLPELSSTQLDTGIEK